MHARTAIVLLASLSLGAAELPQEQLRQGETKQSQIRAQTQQVADQLGAIIEEFRRNGLDGDDVAVLGAIRGVLHKLSDREMQQVIELLQAARSAPDSSKSRTNVVGAISTQKNIAVRLVRKLVPVQEGYSGAKFFVKVAGKWVATPLFVVVVAIEVADLVFAVDSVPAVLAVSDDTFIVYASNAFAILGLRALYFFLSGMLDKFHYLSKGLAIILGFIGVKLILQASHKMISTSVPEIPSLVSLAVIVVVLAGSVILSLKRPAPAKENEALPG